MAEGTQVEAVADELQREFHDDDATVEDVRREVQAVYERYHDARVRQFVPVLVHRYAREALECQRATRSNRTADVS